MVVQQAVGAPGVVRVGVIGGVHGIGVRVDVDQVARAFGIGVFVGVRAGMRVRRGIVRIGFVLHGGSVRVSGHVRMPVPAVGGRVLDRMQFARQRQRRPDHDPDDQQYEQADAEYERRGGGGNSHGPN